MLKTFLFDLDGTLIASPELILRTFEITFKKYLPDITLNAKEKSDLLGHTLFETFNSYVFSKEKVDEMVAFYRETSEAFILKELKAYPGAEETLQALKKKKRKIGIVTSKMIDVAKRHLELTGLLSYVDHIIGYEDTQNHKPNPDPLLKAMEHLNSKPESTIYIGDHENDIKAAKAAKIQSCAVTYSLRTMEMLQENPEFVIDELKHIIDLM